MTGVSLNRIHRDDQNRGIPTQTRPSCSNLVQDGQFAPFFVRGRRASRNKLRIGDDSPPGFGPASPGVYFGGTNKRPTFFVPESWRVECVSTCEECQLVRWFTPRVRNAYFAVDSISVVGLPVAPRRTSLKPSRPNGRGPGLGALLHLEYERRTRV